MKTKSIFALAAAIFGVSIMASPLVFAANPYHIDYTGGEPLGSDNVNINHDLVSELTPLIYGTTSTITSSGQKIQHGYIKDGGLCARYDYITVSNNGLVLPSDAISYTITQDQYVVKANLENVYIDNIENDSMTLTVGLSEGGNYLWGGVIPYSDEKCENQITGISNLNGGLDARIFAKLNIKLYKTGDLTRPFVTDGLYFGITDIDAMQSYKILNTDNGFQKTNTFALNEEGLQAEDMTTNPRNMFVENPNGNYIYSENKVGDTFKHLSLPSTANVYTLLKNNTQENGLDIVFGYAEGAASGIEYYAIQYTVSYESDENGKITGLESEKKFVDDNPSGTEEKPEEGYELSHWVADVDVTLEDGTIIKEGDPITSEQILEIVVDKDINLTAIHEAVEDGPAVPNTGYTSGETNAILVATSVLGTFLSASLIAILPRLKHKKVSFEK